MLHFLFFIVILVLVIRLLFYLAEFLLWIFVVLVTCMGIAIFLLILEILWTLL
jgi:hypothetical protein